MGMKIPPVHAGSKVTKARLNPALKDLLTNISTTQRVVMENEFAESGPLTRQLELALRAYVFDQMPIRLLALPGMQLIDREDIIVHINNKLAHLKREENIELMLETVRKLSKVRVSEADRRNDNPQDEDVREDPLKAVFQFLFSEFGGYAVLSHTWFHGRDWEIRYQDTLAKNWRSRYKKYPGYKKIEGFCNLAQKWGVSLAWADTICINKDSSAELDESIRSMYQWYQDSSICITYLYETSNGPLPAGSTSTTPEHFPDTMPLLYASMNKDRWFTRGWTLQELMAPKRLKFYDHHWRAICLGDNDKDDPDIQSLVLNVTGIGSEDFVSFDPLKTASSVIERMVWATKRTTTRGEDRAYSLMGIFGVSMPTSYGEGAERAFFRLVKAIITSRDISQVIQILAWGGKPISDKIHLSRLIPSSPECFLHNPIALDSISDRLTSNDIAKACQMFPLTGKAMILTHLGLRVRLLLVRAHPVSLLTSGSSKTGQGHEVGPWRVKFTCSNLSFDNPTRHPTGIMGIDLKRMQPYRPRENDFSSICGTIGIHEFVFGIFTFSEEETHVIIPPCFCAFLLAIPMLDNNDFSLESLSPDKFQPKWKIDTHEIIYIHDRTKPDNIRMEKSKNNGTMKVMTVNL
ncbi:hypothetical protein HYPSUDRAFT_191545 [Hypholoma sublateritium FD-334 SS-4]|uniref:Heterokaryon incompatibility domain-containing protein n=1 Tax=Hypholoma sublateritium (strain FD-334 SS-4) TaxID=945553 RepID=A0A0D2NGB2_HYPSF|nr:hypothetical protein HYPSUDRAFT_191545 [Hypholoma sublateritium FD-334 SS-4]